MVLRLILPPEVRETQLQMILHPPNEESTPPGWLWRESAVIHLLKPLQKLLQHQTDELAEADFLIRG